MDEASSSASTEATSCFSALPLYKELESVQSTWQKFSNVSGLVCFFYKVTIYRLLRIFAQSRHSDPLARKPTTSLWHVASTTPLTSLRSI